MARPRKKWRKNAIFLIVLWFILLFASLTILSSVVTPFLKTLQTENLISLDWGGYAVASNVLFPQPQLTGVNGSWTVPTVTATSDDRFSAVWVGIGGQIDSDKTLIQVGTEHDSLGGRAVYYAWYEMLPSNSITIRDVKVSPGDKITASVTLVNSSRQDWLLEISDVTTGEGFSQTFTYNSSQLTGEWIVERPTVNNQISTLADFGSVTLTNLSARIEDTTAAPNVFSNYEIQMEDRQNKRLVTISPLSRDGSSFTVNYG